MVKFFIKQNNNQQKKPTDFKIIIYKQLLGVIRARLLKHINGLVKALKESQLEETVRQLKENRLEQYKQIKKNQIKLCTMYLMVKILNLKKLDTLQQFTKTPVKQTSEEIITSVQSSELLKSFIDSVVQSRLYQTEIEKAANLCDNISQKKKVTKQKSKERKMRKMLSKNQQNQQKEVYNQQEQVKKIVEQAQIDEEAEMIQQPSIQEEKKKKKKENQHFPQKKDNKKQRTQFKKTGRDRALQKKREKKQKYKKKKIEEVKPIKINRILHPSWQAKKQLKKQMFIQPFEGKKITLS